MRKAAMMLCAVGSIATAAYATPFTWNTGFGQGYLEYSLENNDGAELFISCNVGAGQDYDHGVTIYFQGNQVPAYDDDGVLAPIELAIDGRSYSVPEETFSDKGAREWNQLTQALSQVSFFELFWNGEYLGVFNPQNREISKDLADCPDLSDILPRNEYQRYEAARNEEARLRVILDNFDNYTADYYKDFQYQNIKETLVWVVNDRKEVFFLEGVVEGDRNRAHDTLFEYQNYFYILNNYENNNVIDYLQLSNEP